MKRSVQTWFRSVQENLRDRLSGLTSGRRPSAAGRRETQLGLEPLESREVFDVTATIAAGVLTITTDSANDLVLAADATNLTLTTNNPAAPDNDVTVVGGTAPGTAVGSKTILLSDFTSIVVQSGAGVLQFSSVNIQGSANFAAEKLSVDAAAVDFTTGALSVAGLTVASDAAVLLDFAITSSQDVSVQSDAAITISAALNAAGKSATLNAGGNLTQSAGITANKVIASGASVLLTNGGNAVANISGSAATGAFLFNNAGDLNVDGAVSGATSVSLTASGAGKTLSLAADVTAATSITLSADQFDLDGSKTIQAPAVTLATLTAGAAFNLGAPGLTDAELNALSNVTNLTFQGSSTGTMTVSQALDFSDDVTGLVSLQGGTLNVNEGLKASGAAGGLLELFGAQDINLAAGKLYSANAVNVNAGSKDISFTDTPLGVVTEFTQAQLDSFDETTVQTLRFITNGKIGFNSGKIDFTTASPTVVLLAPGAVTQVAGASFTATNLAVQGSSVTLLEDNTVGVVAGQAFTGAFSLKSTSALSVGSVDAAALGKVGVTAATTAVLTAGGALTQTQAITATNLAARGTVIDLSGATNAVSTFAAKTTGVAGTAGDVRFLNGGAALSIGTVDGISGIDAAADPGDATNRALVTIVNDQAITLDQAIDDGAGGQVAVVRLNSTAGTVSQAAAGVVNALSLGVRASTGVSLTAATNVVDLFAARTTSGDVKFTGDSNSVPGAGADVLTIGSVSADGTLFAQTDGVSSASAATNVTIVAGADDNLSVANSVQQDGGLQLATVRLRADGGSVSQTAGGDVHATNLGVRAGTGVDLSAAANAVDLFAAFTAAGDVGLAVNAASAGTLTIGSVAADGGLFALTSGVTSASAASNVTITTNNLSVQIDQAIQKSDGTRLGTVLIGPSAGAPTAGSVAQAAAGAVKAAALGVDAFGAITLNTAANDVGTVALSNHSAAAITFSNSGAGLLTVGAVGTITGITSTSAASTVSVTAANALAVSSPIQTSAAGPLAQVTLSSTASSITQNPGGTIQGAALTITANTDAALNGVVVSTATANVTATTGQVTQAAGGNLQAAALAIQAATGVALDGIIAASASAAIATTAGNVTQAPGGLLSFGLVDATISAANGNVLLSGTTALSANSTTDLGTLSITTKAGNNPTIANLALDFNVPLFLQGDVFTFVTLATPGTTLAAPNLTFNNAGSPATVLQNLGTAVSVLLGGSIVNFNVGAGSTFALQVADTPVDITQLFVIQNAPLTVPAVAPAIAPTAYNTVPDVDQDVFYGQQTNLAGLTVFVKLYSMVGGKKVWVLGGLVKDKDGNVVESGDPFKGNEVLPKLIAVFTETISGKWGEYTLELEEVAPEKEGEKTRATRVVKATFKFNVKTQAELIQALRNIQTVETLFQYFQELPSRGTSPNGTDSEGGAPAARRPRVEAPAQGEGANLFDSVRNQAAKLAQAAPAASVHAAQAAAYLRGAVDDSFIVEVSSDASPPPTGDLWESSEAESAGASSIVTGFAGAVLAASAAVSGRRRKDEPFERDLDSWMALLADRRSDWF